MVQLRLMQARGGYTVGSVIASIGAAIELGIGCGLIAAGLLTILYFVLLFDVDERRDSDEPATTSAVAALADDRSAL